MRLNTSKLISRKRFNPLPLTKELKQRAEVLTLVHNQPVITGGYPLFKWGTNKEVKNMDMNEKMR